MFLPSIWEKNSVKFSNNFSSPCRSCSTLFPKRNNEAVYKKINLDLKIVTRSCFIPWIRCVRFMMTSLVQSTLQLTATNRFLYALALRCPVKILLTCWDVSNCDDQWRDITFSIGKEKNRHPVFIPRSYIFPPCCRENLFSTKMRKLKFPWK